MPKGETNYLATMEAIERKLGIEPLPDMMPLVHTSRMIDDIENELGGIPATTMHSIQRLELLIQEELDHLKQQKEEVE